MRCTVPILAILVFLTGPALRLQAEPGKWDELMAQDGGVIIERQPNQAGGLGADTEFLLGQTPAWQLVADEVFLAESAAVRHVSWWGFYHEDNAPASETMRLRLHIFTCACTSRLPTGYGTVCGTPVTRWKSLAS